MKAARDSDPKRALAEFDNALFGHIGNVYACGARALLMGLTRARYTKVPVGGPTHRYFQQVQRFSAVFALVADAAILTVGGALKKKEMLSARLGDMLSMLYLTSAVLKRFEDQGRPATDLPLVQWACRTLLYRLQEQVHGLLRNLPNRLVAFKLRLLIFPLGRRFQAPSDELTQRVAELITTDSGARRRLAEGVYTAVEPDNPIGQLDKALKTAEQVEPLEKKLHAAVKAGKVNALEVEEQIDQAQNAGILTVEEAQRLHAFERMVMEIITVDDFAPDALGTRPLRKRKRRSAQKRSKPTGQVVA